MPRTRGSTRATGPVILHDSVLVVEDDAAAREYLTAALDGAGYEVRTAPDGAGALDVLATWRPGAVLLDLLLPGMDGWALCEQIAARPELDGLAVIVMSAPENRARPLRGVE